MSAERSRPALAARVGLVVLLFAALSGVLFAEGAAARQSSGIVEDMRVQLTLEQTGDLRVREEFVYTLGADEQHGFRRFIPIKVDYDDSHYRKYTIDGVSVTAEAAGGRVLSGDAAGVDDLATSTDNDNLVIRIGNASTFIDGTWRYVIDYTVHDTVETVEVPEVGTVEELAWNVIGTAWAVPMRSMTMQGELPAAPFNTKCYSGAFRSVDACELVLDGTSMRLELTDVQPAEAATIYLDFRPGTVADATANLEEKWSLARAFEATPWTLGGAILGTAAIGGGLGTLLSRQGRDRRLVLNAYLPAEAEPETEGLAGFFDKPDGPVQFRPPDGMTPGLCGVLTDEKADPLDVSATIVDLAVRGYLRIEQISERKLGSKGDFKLRFLKPPDASLTGYERMLLERLQSVGGGDEVTLSTLRTKFSTQMTEVRKAMYTETMQRRWFRRRPDTVRGSWIAIGIVALIVGGGLSAVLIAVTSWGLLSLPLVLPGLLILATANKMPSRTAKGRRQLELCVGYERFLEVADAEELMFTERQFDYVAGLPYAMVFGITDRWAKVLAVLQEQGMDLTPTWYVPIYAGGVFRYDDFGRSMSDFSSVASAALTAPKPSASGAGGGFGGGGFSGGFSGGGGGGGGGGGW